MTRVAVPLAAILLGMGAYAARSPGERPVVRERADRSAVAPVREVLPAVERSPETPVAGPAKAVPASREPVVRAPLSEPHVVNRPVMVGLLRRELDLTPDQLRWVEDVFQRRERVIDERHRQILALNVLSGEAYHRGMQELRSQSYAEVGQVLYAAQHRSFLEIVASGALNDVIGFETPEGMVEVE